jgi:hypothetical protein
MRTFFIFIYSGDHLIPVPYDFVVSHLHDNSCARTKLDDQYVRHTVWGTFTLQVSCIFHLRWDKILTGCRGHGSVSGASVTRATVRSSHDRVLRLDSKSPNPISVADRPARWPSFPSQCFLAQPTSRQHLGLSHQSTTPLVKEFTCLDFLGLEASMRSSILGTRIRARARLVQV